MANILPLLPSHRDMEEQEPRSWKEAMKSQHADKCRKANKKIELKADAEAAKKAKESAKKDEVPVMPKTGKEKKAEKSKKGALKKGGCVVTRTHEREVDLAPPAHEAHRPEVPFQVGSGSFQCQGVHQQRPNFAILRVDGGW